MKNIIKVCFLNLILLNSLHAEISASNSYSNVVVKAEDQSVEVMYGKRGLKFNLEIPGSSKVFRAHVSEDGAEVILQTRNGKVYIVDVASKAMSEVGSPVSSAISVVKKLDKNVFLFGTDRGSVYNVSFDLASKEKFKSGMIIAGRNLPVEDIVFSKDGTMFYVTTQNSLADPAGYEFKNNLLTDLVSAERKASIGYKEVDLTPSTFQRLHVGYKRSPLISNIDSIAGKYANIYNRAKVGASSLIVFAFGDKGQIVPVFSVADYSSVALSENFEDIAISFGKKGNASLIDLKKSLANQGGELVSTELPIKNFDFVQFTGDKIVVASADSKEVLVLNANGKLSKKMDFKSNIRQILPAEDGFYVILENGKIDFLHRVGDSYSSFEMLGKGNQLARNINAQRVGNTVVVTGADRIRKALVLPNSCSQVFGLGL